MGIEPIQTALQKPIKCGVSRSLVGGARLACEFRVTRDNPSAFYRISAIDPQAAGSQCRLCGHEIAELADYLEINFTWSRSDNLSHNRRL
jgi:hypothetical protein